jgi:hypothetical protein
MGYSAREYVHFSPWRNKSSHKRSSLKPKSARPTQLTITMEPAIAANEKNVLTILICRI